MARKKISKKTTKKVIKKVIIKKEDKIEQKIEKKYSRNTYYFVGILVVILALVFIGLNYNGIFGKEAKKIQTCGDGSFYDTCSIMKPYLCENGKLIEAARFCGCPEGFSKAEDKCVSSLLANSKQSSFEYLLNGEKANFNLELYKGLYDSFANVSRQITYNGEEKPFRVDFKFKKINEENQKQELDKIVVSIENIASSKEDQARIAISLVQNIPFEESSKKIKVGNSSIDYSRYPYEVLYENAGVCGEKSELLAFLLKELGYGTVLFYNQAENHESVGIACPVEQSYWGSGYCFVETSAPSIVSDDEISYVGGVKLTSKPEIMFISPGVSLPQDLEEYKDAENLIKIRKKLEQGKSLNPSERNTLDDLNDKYGLVEIYNSWK